MTLRKRIREKLRDGREIDVRTLSKEIIRELRNFEVVAALEVALPYLVRDEIRKYRHEAIGKPPVRGRESWEQLAEKPAAVAKRSQVRRASGKRASQVSHERRERASALMRTPVSVGGKWKTLGECTPADLRELAEGNYARAHENSKRGDGYVKLVKLCEKAGVATVGELDGEQVREAFGATL